MEEKKNKSTGKTVTIIILIILLLGLGGYLTYDKLVLDKNAKNNLEQTQDNLEIEKRKNKENTTKINKLEKDSKEQSNVEEKNYLVTNFHTIAEDIHIYSIGYDNVIYAYKGEMYASFDVHDPKDSTGNAKLHDKLDIITATNPAKTSKSNNYYEVKKLNIKESEVNKVLSFNDFTTTDAQYDVYIIYKNGKVHILHDASEDSGYAFKNYKVNDLRVSCKKRGEFGCETVNYKLTLQNGTEKTVTKP